MVLGARGRFCRGLGIDRICSQLHPHFRVDCRGTPAHSTGANFSRNRAGSSNGNFVDPRLQGRTLKLSPFVALLSIVFWGWVWGIPGALLGIPMTMSLVVFSQEFKSTRAIALLFGDTDDPELKKKLK